MCLLHYLLDFFKKLLDVSTLYVVYIVMLDKTAK